MAFVRTRRSKAGAISTVLLEAYRDDQGRPRHRVLANLHGEPDLLNALAKLAARREALRKEQKTLDAEAVDANKFYEIVTQKTLAGHQHSETERKEIDGLMRLREHLLRRLEKIEADLAVIQKDGAVIRKHCTATADEVQAAIHAYKQRHRDAEVLVLGMELMQREKFKKARAKLRRLSS
jgi:hypothetical protein